MGFGRQSTVRVFSSREVRSITMDQVHHLNVGLLRKCVNERGKIYSAKRTGFPVQMQRRLREAVMRARYLALLPYDPTHRKTAPVGSTAAAVAEAPAATAAAAETEAPTATAVAEPAAEEAEAEEAAAEDVPVAEEEAEPAPAEEEPAAEAEAEEAPAEPSAEEAEKAE